MYILFMLLFLVERLYLVHCNLSNKIVENGFMVYVFVLTLVTSFLSYQRVGNFGNHPYHFGTLNLKEVVGHPVHVLNVEEVFGLSLKNQEVVHPLPQFVQEAEDCLWPAQPKSIQLEECIPIPCFVSSPYVPSLISNSSCGLFLSIRDKENFWSSSLLTESNAAQENTVAYQTILDNVRLRQLMRRNRDVAGDTVDAPGGSTASPDPRSSDTLEEEFVEDLPSSQEAEWDTFQEEPSFLSNPSSYSPVDRVNRRSSTDNFFLGSPPEPFNLSEEEVLPLGLFEDPNSEDYYSSEAEDIIEEVMPPKTPAQNYEDFLHLYTVFKDDHALVEGLGREADELSIQELLEQFQKINKIYLAVTKADGNYAVTFPELKIKRDELFLLNNGLRTKLKEIQKVNAPPVEAVHSPTNDEKVEENLKTYKAKYDALDRKVGFTFDDMNTVMDTYVNPGLEDRKEMQDLMSILIDLRNQLEEITYEFKNEAAKFDDETKKNAAINEFNDKWSQKKAGINNMLCKGRVYVRKENSTQDVQSNSTPTVVTSEVRHSKINLERLPLPVFHGNEMEYLRFKQDFTTYVNYESEAEKVHALKAKCLKKPEDRKRISNITKLVDCWKVLDLKYGDKNVLVTKLLTSWEQLKAPRNDTEFVEFVEKIEHDAHLLEYVGYANDMNSSHNAITLERKLPEFEHKLYSQEMIANEDNSKERMKKLLEFLVKQKKASLLRLANKNEKGEKKKKEDDEIFSGGSFVRGRGKGSFDRSGRGKGSIAGKGKGRGFPKKEEKLKRGEPDSKCLLCKEDHTTSKCYNWQDFSHDKNILWQMASQQKKPFCIWCLEPGHMERKCTCKEDLGCPCGSDTNRFLCVRTKECRDRSNWKDSANVKSSCNASSSNTVVNGVRMGETLLPIQYLRILAYLMTNLSKSCLTIAVNLPLSQTTQQET